MKKFLALLLVLVMALGLVACSVEQANNGGSNTTNNTQNDTTNNTTDDTTGDTTGEAVEISLWTYPIGDWGKPEVVSEIIAKFNEKYPNITVTHQLLDYSNGDAQVNTAMEGGTVGDIIMEGPERLVSNWGANGKMVDLSDMWTDEMKADMASASIEKACQWTDGAYYEYPLCMTTHCMAINYETFEAAGALQYIDEETRTWTTDDFVKACEALRDAGYSVPGIVYCGGTGGDQGTRALVRNLYSADFTDAEHTKYTMNSENGIKGLQLLIDMVNDKSMTYDAGIVASDELTLFANGTSCMSLCWNASNWANYASQTNFTPFAMTFPSDDGQPELDGGIWGFGIVDKGDQAKIDAAKTFIDFVCNDESQASDSVYATGFFPVRSSLGDIYAGTEKEGYSEFMMFMPYLGDYYNVTPKWAEQRTAWFEMLQAAFSSGDAASALAEYDTKANG